MAIILAWTCLLVTVATVVTWISPMFCPLRRPPLVQSRRTQTEAGRPQLLGMEQCTAEMVLAVVAPMDSEGRGFLGMMHRPRPEVLTGSILVMDLEGPPVLARCLGIGPMFQQSSKDPSVATPTLVVRPRPQRVAPPQGM